MEEFNLEKFNTGDYDVFTRDGHSVRIVCTDRKSKFYTLICLISKYDYEEIILLTTGGKYNSDCSEHNYDIFLKKKKWVPKKGEKYWFVSSCGEVFEDKNSNSDFEVRMFGFGNYFKTKKEAEEMAIKIRQVLNNY